MGVKVEVRTYIGNYTKGYIASIVYKDQINNNNNKKKKIELLSLNGFVTL